MPCYNGQTYVNTVIPFPGATAAAATYVFDLTHYFCGNRKVCANGAYPIGADLKFQVVGSPRAAGNDAYLVDILITGQVTYLPYRNGQNCGCGCECNCPKTDNIYATISVPWGSPTAPALTAGEASASPVNVRDCCPITNACSITGSCSLATAAAASPDVNANRSSK